MACTVCGNDGHNSRTCPQLPHVPTGNPSPSSDHALWMRYGGLTKDQAKELKRTVEEAIEKIAPDSYGVIAAGKASRLPERIQEAIKATQGDAKKLESSDD